jgi:hypothetical protein
MHDEAENLISPLAMINSHSVIKPQYSLTNSQQPPLTVSKTNCVPLCLPFLRPVFYYLFIQGPRTSKNFFLFTVPIQNPARQHYK